MNIIATTTQSKAEISEEFEQFLTESGLPLRPRCRRSLPQLLRENEAQGVVVWHPSGPQLHLGDQILFYHPSMAKNRISFFRKKGLADPLVKACRLREDTAFLDCTLGMGADALVAAYFAPQGRVVGLEHSAVMALVIKWGMKLYQSSMPWLDAAIKRIEVIPAEHGAYLSWLESNSFDVVYFDPMFRQPRRQSNALEPLRLLADHRALSREVLEQACRVARQRVVVKEMPASREFSRLGIEKIEGSPHNPIAFGIIEL